MYKKNTYHCGSSILAASEANVLQTKNAIYSAYLLQKESGKGTPREMSPQRVVGKEGKLPVEGFLKCNWEFQYTKQLGGSGIRVTQKKPLSEMLVSFLETLKSSFKESVKPALCCFKV